MFDELLKNEDNLGTITKDSSVGFWLMDLNNRNLQISFLLNIHTNEEFIQLNHSQITSDGFHDLGNPEIFCRLPGNKFPSVFKEHKLETVNKTLNNFASKNNWVPVFYQEHRIKPSIQITCE